MKTMSLFAVECCTKLCHGYEAMQLKIVYGDKIILYRVYL